MRVRTFCATASLAVSGVVLPWQATPATAATPTTETTQVLVSNQEAGTGCLNQRVLIADAFSGALVKDLGKPSFMDGALSDAKPIDYNRSVLAVWGGHDDSTPTDGISQRPGGVGIADRNGVWVKAYTLPNSFKTGQGNAHSVAPLPDGNFAVALAGPLNNGSQWGHVVVLRPPATNGAALTYVSSVALDDAHGVEWDSKRQEVFAIGKDHVKRYRYASGTLHLISSHDLPRAPDGGTPGGHDIRKRRNVAGTYFVTTNSNVYEFTPETGAFSPPLTKTGGGTIGSGVKSIDDRFDGVKAYSQSRDRFYTDNGTIAKSTAAGFCMASYKQSRWIWAAGQPVYRDDEAGTTPTTTTPAPSDRRFVWGDDVLTGTTRTETTNAAGDHLWVGGTAWNDQYAVRSEIQKRVADGKIPYIFFYQWGDNANPGIKDFNRVGDEAIRYWKSFATRIAEGIGDGHPAYVVVEPEWDLDVTEACSTKYQTHLKEVVNILRGADKVILVNGMGFWSMSADWKMNTAYNCFDTAASWFDLHGFTTHVVSNSSSCTARTSNYGGPYTSGVSLTEARRVVEHVKAKAGYLRSLFTVDQFILYDTAITRCGWGSAGQNELYDLLADALPSLYDELGLRGAYIRNGGPSDGERALGIGNEGGFEYKTQTANTRIEAAMTEMQNHLKTYGTSTPAPTFASGATAQSAASPGDTVPINALVTNKTNGANDAVVTVEVWNGTTLVNKGTWNAQDFAVGQERSYTYNWPVPATAGGTYTVKIGVFGTGGSPTYHWNGGADTISVTAGSTRPAFTSTASSSTVAGGTTASVPVTVNNVGGALSDGIVAVELHDSGGSRVAQRVFEHQNLAAGSSTSYTADLLTPTTAGTYTVKVGVSGPDFTPSYHWNDNAGTVTVTPASMAFSSSASASRSTVAPGGTTTITATVTNTGTSALTNGIVDLEVYDSAGTRRGQQYFTAQSIPAGGSQTYTWTWTAPTSTGSHAVKVGVFSSDWATTYHWNPRATTIGVTAIDVDTTASASPAVIAPSGTTTITSTVTNNGGALENGVVQAELYNPAGTRLDTESWTQSFASGQTVSFPWTVTMPATAGSHVVKVGVFGPGFTPTYEYNSNAAVVTVKAPSFVSTADVSASSVLPGQSVTITANFTNNGGSLGDGIPQLKIYNSAGSLVYGFDWGHHAFGNGETKSFTKAWTAPTTTGTYTVKLGVFGSTWSPTHHWNDNAARISVGTTFQPSFRVGDGANNWWIEVYTSSDVTSVDVIGGDGRFYLSLPKKSWGAFAATAPSQLQSGELVRFIARRSTDGATAGSSNFGWLTQAPSTDPGWVSTFTVGAGANANWVEIYVSPEATAVEVKVGTGAFTALTKQTWGAWTRSMSVPAGSKVVFRATKADGARAYSPVYNWLQ